MKKIVLFTILFGNYCLTMATDKAELLEQIKNKLKDKCAQETISLNGTKLSAYCHDKDKKSIYSEIEIYNDEINLDVDDDGSLVKGQ
jgi:hypothetical protein